MKLTVKQLKCHLQNILPRLEWSTQVIVTDAGDFIRFNNVSDLANAIQQIKDLGFFDDWIIKTRQSGLLEQPGNHFHIPRAEGELMVKELETLGEYLFKLNDILLSNVPDEDPNSINIKLPPFVSDFGDLEKVSHNLHIALSQLVLHDEIGGQKKMVSIENGSIWFNILVGPTAITLIGNLIWAASVIYKKCRRPSY